MSLTGKTILVTRQVEQAGEMIAEIERRGGTAVVMPAIRITEPLSWEDCDRALSRIQDFDAAVFASVNAVEAFFGRAAGLGIDVSVVTGLELGAVGPRTARALEGWGLRVHVVAQSFSANGLAASLAEHNAAWKKVLVPRGDLARDDLVSALMSMGIGVESVTVYRTSPPDPADAALLVRRLAARAFDVITFASPSAVRNFSTMLATRPLDEARQGVPVAVIGETTRDAVRSLGSDAAIVATVSTARGLVDAIEMYFEHSRR